VPSGKTSYNDKEDFVYVMLLDENGEVDSEPYIASETYYENSQIKNNKIIITASDIPPAY
jgi:hypothetical protein